MIKRHAVDFESKAPFGPKGLLASARLSSFLASLLGSAAGARGWPLARVTTDWARPSGQSGTNPLALSPGNAARIDASDDRQTGRRELAGVYAAGMAALYAHLDAVPASSYAAASLDLQLCAEHGLLSAELLKSQHAHLRRLPAGWASGCPAKGRKNRTGSVPEEPIAAARA